MPTNPASVGTMSIWVTSGTHWFPCSPQVHECMHASNGVDNEPVDPVPDASRPWSALPLVLSGFRPKYASTSTAISTLSTSSGPPPPWSPVTVWP